MHHLELGLAFTPSLPSVRAFGSSAERHEKLSRRETDVDANPPANRAALCVGNGRVWPKVENHGNIPSRLSVTVCSIPQGDTGRSRNLSKKPRVAGLMNCLHCLRAWF